MAFTVAAPIGVLSVKVSASSHVETRNAGSPVSAYPGGIVKRGVGSWFFMVVFQYVVTICAGLGVFCELEEIELAGVHDG